MINKRKNLILSICIIFGIQILLLVNNKQKSSFRYFIWNIQEVSIGRLIFISFVSGLCMSSVLNKAQSNNIRTKPIIEGNDNTTEEQDYSVISEDNDESYDIAPERDLREPQPTISVNYRVIKNYGENDFKDRKQTTSNSQYENDDDDWNNNDSEW